MAPTNTEQTVLIVEDDDTTRASFELALREHGYRVGLAANGHEALDYLRDHPATDLILLDMMTPGMDGWQFLKKRGRWASVPVLIATAIGVASKEWAASLGARGLIRKPIRALRAVDVLELIATPAARKFLQTLASGAPAARLTREAQTPLDRLQRRAAALP